MTEFEEIYGLYATRGDTCLVFICIHMVIQIARTHELVRGSVTSDTKSGVMKLCLITYFRKIYNFFSVSGR